LSNRVWRHLLPLRVAIITQSASKPPGGPESCSSGVQLTKAVFEKNHPRNNLLPNMDTYGVQYVIWNDNVLSLHVAIITQCAIKPDGLESYSSDIELTTTTIYYLCVLRPSHRAPASLLAAQRAVAVALSSPRPVLKKSSKKSFTCRYGRLWHLICYLA
jgi:hypothetical protein